MRSALSCADLSPGKTIFVPGMYFLGSSRYSKRVSLLQVMPVRKNSRTRYISQCHLLSGLRHVALTLVLVGITVVESRSLPSLSSNHTMKIGSYLVLSSLLNGVTLGTPLNKNLLALLGVSFWDGHAGCDCLFTGCLGVSRRFLTTSGGS